MRTRNLRRTGAVALASLATLAAAIACVEANGDATIPTQLDSASRTGTPTSAAASAPASTPPALLAPATVASVPATPSAAGALAGPASATRPEAATDDAAVSPIRARVGIVAATSAPATDAIATTALAAYQRAASVIDQADTTCHLDWQLLAAIGHVESADGTTGGSVLGADGVASPAIYGPRLNGRHHTRRIVDTDSGTLDADKRFDRAVGPMQILPATWVQIAVDGDGDGRRDPQDINDAALASAVYLCSTGADLSTAAARKAALLRYNHSDAYATTVLALATGYLADATLGGGVVPATYLLPPAIGIDDTAAAAGGSGAAGTAKKGTKDKGAKKSTKPGKHGKHGGSGKKAKHHDTTKTSPPKTTGPGSPAGPAAPPSPAASAPASSAPSQPGGQPSEQPSGQPGTSPATSGQLTDVCHDALARAYPDATAAALDSATTACVAKLDGLTLAQATAKLDDVVADLPDTVPGLTPEQDASPTPDPSATPSSATSPETASPASSPASSAPTAD